MSLQQVATFSSSVPNQAGFVFVYLPPRSEKASEHLRRWGLWITPWERLCPSASSRSALQSWGWICRCPKGGWEHQQTLLHLFWAKFSFLFLPSSLSPFLPFPFLFPQPFFLSCITSPRPNQTWLISSSIAELFRILSNLFLSNLL